MPQDAVARGATEVCIQGGIHPNKDHTHYREILVAIKAEFPISTSTPTRPRRSTSATARAACQLADYLRWLIDAGLGSDAGHRGRDPRRRDSRDLSPRKLRTARWVEIVRGRALGRAALDLDAHVRPHRDPATSRTHLGLLRDIQKDTGGFTEFVPLGFIHERNMLYNRLGSRPGCERWPRI